MKMNNFHLLGHFWLHLDHSVEEIFEQLKFLTLAVKSHSVGVDWAYCELLCSSSILHRSQDVGQSSNGIRIGSCSKSLVRWDRRVKVDVLVGLIEMSS